MKVNKLMKWMGFYEEDNRLRLDGRRVYYWTGLLIIISFGYEALFVHTLAMDMWGFTSPYIVKLFLIILAFSMGWFYWGYYRLVKRVKELEGAKEGKTEMGDKE